MMISGMRNNTKRIIKNILTLIIVLALWQISAMMIGKPVYYPTFFDTLRAFYQMALTSKFWLAAGISLIRVLGGFVSALAIGVFLAVVSSFFPVITDFIKTLMGVAKATPVASFIILAMIWMRSPYVPVLVAVLMIAPIIYENTLQGINSIEKDIIEMSKVYTISAFTFIKKIAVPYTRPYLTAAIFSSFGIGFKAVVSAEILAHPLVGIGTDIYDAKIYLNTAELFALTITVIILSLLLEKIISKLLSRSARVNHEIRI